MCRDFIEKKGKPKEVVSLGALYTLLTKGDKLWSNDYTDRGSLDF